MFSLLTLVDFTRAYVLVHYISLILPIFIVELYMYAPICKGLEIRLEDHINIYTYSLL